MEICWTSIGRPDGRTFDGRLLDAMDAQQCPTDVRQMAVRRLSDVNRATQAFKGEREGILSWNSAGGIAVPFVHEEKSIEIFAPKVQRKNIKFVEREAFVKKRSPPAD